MTTTRSKSVGRAADAARRAKHNQTNPLPPKGAAAPEKTYTASVQQAAEDAGLVAPVVAPTDEQVDAAATDIAGTVKERRDQGHTWREISEALTLGEGKTGTSRARRLYRQANEGAAAPKKEPVARIRRAAADPYADSTDGTPAVSRSRAASMPIVRLDHMRLHAVDKRTQAQRGNRKPMGDVHTAEVGSQQIKGLRNLFESDGYTVTVEKMQADDTWAVV